MATDAKGFQAELEAVFGRVLADTHERARELAIDAANSIILKTPVDTGQARANWIAAVGEIDRTTTEEVDKTGANAIQQATAKAAEFEPYGTFFITNSLPYIEVLENGGFTPENPGPSKDKRKGRQGEILVADGYSVQAPEGMVKKTAMELVAEYSR